MSDSDAIFMDEAILLSAKGFPAPNPRVGAVVVRDGTVVGRGFHAFAGGPHAEIVALKEAGELARGAELFVTLEPCNHEGKTPACTDAILSSGISRVVYASADPNPIAAGGDFKLRSNKIVVDVGLKREEAESINYLFVNRYRLGRPWVLVKCGITLDGRIATKRGESKWITGAEARARAHFLRAQTGCVLVGAGTIAADNPALTIREMEVINQPLRIVLDAKGELKPTSAVFSDGRATIWVTNEPKVNSPVENWAISSRGRFVFDLAKFLQELARRGVISVLIEGGGKTVAAFFEQKFVDEVELHVAPQAFGNGRAWFEGEGVAQLADAWQFESLQSEPLGDGIRINARVKR